MKKEALLGIASRHQTHARLERQMFKIMTA